MGGGGGRHFLLGNLWKDQLSMNHSLATSCIQQNILHLLALNKPCPYTPRSLCALARCFFPAEKGAFFASGQSLLICPNFLQIPAGHVQLGK